MKGLSLGFSISDVSAFRGDRQGRILLLLSAIVLLYQQKAIFARMDEMLRDFQSDDAMVKLSRAVPADSSDPVVSGQPVGQCRDFT